MVPPRSSNGKLMLEFSWGEAVNVKRKRRHIMQLREHRTMQFTR